MLRSAEAALTCQEPAWRFLGHLLAKQIRVVAGDLRNIPRYVLRALIGATLVCGSLSLWGLHGDGTIPGMAPLCRLDPYRFSSIKCIAGETTAADRWNGLAPALAILDQVNPTVAKWLREKYANSLVVFDDQWQTKRDAGTALAKYDMLRGCVVVNPALYCENDGTIAVILCHEYRHSRQNLGKFCQYVLSFLFMREGDLSIIENDAVIYEQEGHDAIFGNGASRERQLAAWEHAARAVDQAAGLGRASRLSIPVVAKANQSP